MDMYSETEKRLAEINRIIHENEQDIKERNGFSIFATCMFRRDGELNYSHTAILHGEKIKIVGNVSIYMVDNPALIPIMEQAIAAAKHILANNPDVVNGIRNSENIDL